MRTIARRNGWVLASLLGAGTLVAVGCSDAPQTSDKDAATEVASGSGGSGSGGATGSGGSTPGSGGSTPGSGGAAPGSGGATGSGGAIVTPPDGGGNQGNDATVDNGPGNARPTCTLVIGVSVTYDWFTGGFEAAGSGIENGRWEGLAPSVSRMSFIQNWADANSDLWSMAKLSPCTTNPGNPDRVIFVGVNWDYRTAAQWMAQYDAVIATLKGKFSNLKTIYLDTLIRGPGNKNCGGNDTTSEVVVRPYIDEAIQMAVAKYPGLVKAATKLYVPACTVFTGAGPHFTAAGTRTVAKVYSDLYATDQ